MILVGLIIFLLLGGGAAWYAERWGEQWPRWITLGALLVDVLLLLAISVAVEAPDGSGVSGWYMSHQWQWIPRFGISFHLAVDGLSALLIALTIFLGFMSVCCSWTEIQQDVGFFHFNILWTLAGVIGVFLAVDLFLFFFFWEVMIIPMYFLISIWGHENRAYAAIKFFIFTQASGLLMLLAIVVLAFTHASDQGVLTFNYFELLENDIDGDLAFWLMLGFFVAFVVKLPSVPFHTWLPDAHTQAPTGGSVLLAGVLLKTGAYGLLRFVVPLFPEAARSFSPVAMGLGVVSILYGAKLAFAQTDIKRLVAYSSISHMGFILVGVFAWNTWALQGAVMTMLAHGISSAALFMVAGAMQERIHTRDLSRMGGLWHSVPRVAAIALFFAVAALGMPGLGNFIGEFLVLLGAFQVSIPLTIVATLGLILAPVYALMVIQKAFLGKAEETHPILDFGVREMVMMGFMIVATVWIGLYPQGMLDISNPVVEDNLNRIPARKIQP